MIKLVKSVEDRLILILLRFEGPKTYLTLNNNCNQPNLHNGQPFKCVFDFASNFDFLM